MVIFFILFDSYFGMKRYVFIEHFNNIGEIYVNIYVVLFNIIFIIVCIVNNYVDYIIIKNKLYIKNITIEKINSRIY